MARMDVVGLEKAELQMQGLTDRGKIKAIVMAGADRAVQEWKNLITRSRHVRSGGMRDAVSSGDYVETMGGGKAVAYPRGTAPTRISQTAKAYVINYGRGGRKSERMGDRFITKDDSNMERLVLEAMQAEADKILGK